jgi:hypothetical protein
MRTASIGNTSEPDACIIDAPSKTRTKLSSMICVFVIPVNNGERSSRSVPEKRLLLRVNKPSSTRGCGRNVHTPGSIASQQRNKRLYYTHNDLLCVSDSDEHDQRARDEVIDVLCLVH